MSALKFNTATSVHHEKQCLTCNAQKPLSDFHRNRKASDGHMSHCKDCRRITTKQRYADRREELCAQGKEWYVKNRQRLASLPPSPLATKTCQSCHETKPSTDFHQDPSRKDGRKESCKACRCALYRGPDTPPKNYASSEKERLERARIRAKEWAKSHAAHVRMRQRKWEHDNPDKVREYDRRWRAKHPDKVVEFVERRRARKLAVAVNDFTAEQWLAMKAHYKYCCVYCGKKQQRLSQDHITPLSKGGNHTVRYPGLKAGACRWLTASPCRKGMDRHARLSAV